LAESALVSRKRLAINIVANGLSLLANFLVGFLLTPYITKSVGIEGYGFVGLALSITSYVSIATIAINSMAGRFIAISYHKQEYDKANDYFNSILIVNALIAVVMVIPFALLVSFVSNVFNVPGRLLLDVQLLFGFTFIWFLVGLAGTAFSVATFVSNRLDLSSARSIVSSVIRLASVGLMYIYLKPAVYYMGISFAAIAIFEVAVNIHFIKKLTPKLKVNMKSMSWSCLREMFIAGIWNSLNAIGNILARGLDLLVANLFLGPVAMGVLAIGKTIPAFISSMIGAMGSPFSPQFTYTYALDNPAELKIQIVQSIKILGVLSNVPIILLAVLGSKFFKLWMPNEDATILHVVSIICIFDYAVAGCLEGLHGIFYVVNRIKATSLFYFCSGLANAIVVLIAMQFVQDRTAGVYVVAGVSTVIGFFGALLFLPVYGARCLGLKSGVFYPAVLRSLFLCVSLSIACYFMLNHVETQSWITLGLLAIGLAILSATVNAIVSFGWGKSIHYACVIARRLSKRRAMA